MVNLTAKKVYCPKCQKLVHVKQQQSGEKNQFACIKCNHVMWEKAGSIWKFKKAI